MDSRLVGKERIDERSNWRGVNSEDDMLSYFRDKNMPAALRIDEYLLKDESGYWLSIKHYGARAKDSTIERISVEEAQAFILGRLDEEVYNEPHYEIYLQEFGIDLRPKTETKKERKKRATFTEKNIVTFSDIKRCAKDTLNHIDDGEFYLLVNGRYGKVIGILMSADNYEKYGFDLNPVDFSVRDIQKTWTVIKSTIEGYNEERAICFKDNRTSTKKPIRYIVSLKKFQEKFNVKFDCKGVI